MEIDNKKCKVCVHYNNERCVLDDLETCRFMKKHESFLHNGKLLKYAYSKDGKDIYYCSETGEHYYVSDNNIISISNYGSNNC